MSLPEPYYQNEQVTLYCGDCREILPLLPRVDLVLTDPPYGIGINKSHRLSTSRGFGGETWDNEPCDDSVIRWILDSRISAIVWGGNYFNLPPTKCFLAWDKMNDGRDFADLEMAWTNLDSVARIFRKRPMNMDGGKVHPTQKPLALMKWCIGLADDPQTILDPFAGSGTTLRAAMDLGRKAIGIEISEKYCEIAKKRLLQKNLAFAEAM